MEATEMDILRYLQNATKEKLIKWEPTGEEIEIYKDDLRFHIILRGYETKINGFRVRTIIRPCKPNFWGPKEVYAIHVEGNGKSITLTSDPKTLPGVEVEHLFITIGNLNRWIEEKERKENLLNSLRESLSLIVQ